MAFVPAPLALEAADVPTEQGKRLTKVERARLEAMAAFGNCGFNNLKTKKNDFQSKLAISPINSTVSAEKRLTRMQLAKLEANKAFSNIKLGDNVSRPAKRKRIERQEINRVPKVRKLTRPEQARVDANIALQNLPLGKRSVNENKVRSSKENNTEKRQRMTKAEFMQKETMKSFRGKALDELQQHVVKPPVALTGREEEVANSRDAAVGTSPIMAGSVTVATGTVTDDTTTVTDGIGTVMVGTRTVTDDTAPVTDGIGTVRDGTETVTVGAATVTDITATVTVNSQALLGSKAYMNYSTCTVDSGTHSGTVAFEAVTEDSKAVRMDSEAVTEDSKAVRMDSEAVTVGANGTSKELLTTQQRLTRVERARLEALKSFGGQGLGDVYKTSKRKLAKYLTPKKSQATNTKRVKTSTTPCQTDPLPIVSVVMATQKAAGPKGKTPTSLQNSEVNLSGASDKKRSVGRYPKPKTSLYSNIDAEASFGSLDALLETSRRVIQTAKMLETPP